MPNLSGLHICRTTSSGHSSRASSSCSVSSDRRFFAKSLSAFTLALSVFFAIMGGASPFLFGNESQFTDLAGQLRQKLQDVVDNSNVGHLKYWRFGVLVDGHHEGITFNPGQMLERTTDAAGHVDLRLDGLTG